MYVSKIPLELREFFERNASREYEFHINSKIPFEDQEIKESTVNILAMLNVNYWCETEEHKQELLKRYQENDLKHALALIFSEGIKSYGISEDLISIMPYEECYYDTFDLVINLDENKIDKRQDSEKLFIYKTNNNFDLDIEKEINYLEKYKMNYEIITDDFDIAVKKINREKPIGAAIYTNEAELGYKFINMIHSKNVFVNTSFAELDTKIENLENVLYIKKKIMYPN